ncbi:MAG: 2,3-bisphosphoglycerate-independent phosphoglycerate mutase [Actinobacteria bacterium]|nr:2,3-bisphosphoglycerate-independent phosphoglycerate mutase [Actinomycetota bacterium]MCL6087545.1 2,3-bisphosphoglycerate-independent phosphoglycerate mutase [Actinomycetota bacterium]
MESLNKKIKYPVCLIILDGWGISKVKTGNAIFSANKPNMDGYLKNYPNTLLSASGLAVGLPEGQMGNSEVGHLNIGAGRIVYQDLTKITRSIELGKFFHKEAFTAAINNVKKNNSSLHLMGLLSDGGVHSHINHLKALINLAAQNNIKNLFIHAFLDGRDVPPRCALTYLIEIKKYMDSAGYGNLATVCGRYYAMDRDNRWERVKKAYDNLVYRNGEHFNNAEELIKKSYKDNIDDEFVIPACIDVIDEDMAKIKSNDSIIFFNFRPDRAREISRSFIYRDFQEFDRGNAAPENIVFVCMTEYDIKFNSVPNVYIAYPAKDIVNTLGEVISKNNLRQLRIAETEKYAHVTFFFNGGVEKPNPGEDRILIPSPKVPTYDLKPEMSAYEVTDKLIEKIKENIYQLIIVNFANPDMVGHTGFFEPAVKAIEAVDKCIGRIVNEINEVGGTAIITADHGNAEEMINPEMQCPMTAHTTSRVPFILCSSDVKELNGEEESPKLCDIAPTILELMKIKKPQEMTGISLIKSWK